MNHSIHADSKDSGEMATMNRLKYEISLVVNDIYDVPI